MKTYRAAVIGCGRMGGFIDNEVVGTPGYVEPYAHGAGFHQCDRTDLVACSDFREDLMDEFGRQYDVPKGRQYTDYKKMISSEGLDIVSVAVHVEHHADIVVHAAESGVPAIFCEKGLAPSLTDANRMADACKSNGVALNMGAQRRFDPGFWKVREMIESGELGPITSLVMTYASGLFDHGCHVMDLAQYLNGDSPAVWVQGNAPQSEPLRDGSVSSDDPGGDGVVLFENGVTLYLQNMERYEYRINWRERHRPDLQRHARVANAQGKGTRIEGRGVPRFPRGERHAELDLGLGAGIGYGQAPVGRDGIGPPRRRDHDGYSGVSSPGRQANPHAAGEQRATNGQGQPSAMAEGPPLARAAILSGVGNGTQGILFREFFF